MPRNRRLFVSMNQGPSTPLRPPPHWLVGTKHLETPPPRTDLVVLLLQTDQKGLDVVVPETNFGFTRDY